MPSQVAPVLSVQNLHIPLPVGSDRRYAVQDLSFQLHAGEILCLVGESGSGKSMSANAIMGLLPPGLSPESGSILFKGGDLLQQSERTLLSMRGKDMSMIFQEPLSALNPLMMVGEQIVEVMRVHGLRDEAKNQQRVLELLNVVGLPDPQHLQSSYPFRLSGGQRQRVMIAMALALEPSVLIADEPTTALDVTTQAQILSLIQDIQKSKGMGVLFVTHDFGVVAEIAHRVAVMEKGVMVEIGTAQQVLNQPQHAYTQKLINAVPHGRSSSATPRPHDAPLLKVEHMRKKYVLGGGWFRPKRIVQAVDDVSFQVCQGQTLGIVGESGSGKSTIGKCLLRLTPVDGGSIIFDQHDLVPLSPGQLRPMRRHLQMIFQDPFASLNPRHTIGKIITSGPIASGIDKKEAYRYAHELLEWVGLEASALERYPNQFSGGQRQRIGIARALALHPKLIVADESVSALDVSVQAQVLELLARLQKKLNLALIFITHDLRVAAQICNHIMVMHRGKIVESGSPNEVFNRPSHEYTQQLINAIPGRSWVPPSVQAPVV